MADHIKSKKGKTAKELNVKPVYLESGIEVNPVYTSEDLQNSAHTLEMPGEYPFTRGIHPTMYRNKPFTIRQYAGFASPEETNERFLFLIKNGQSGLNVAFDLPTQCGLDSDDPRAFGEVGRVGMSIDTLHDFEIAFKNIDLDKITVSLTINGTAIILIAMYVAMAEKLGYDIAKLRGTAQNDILKEFIGRGTWIFPVDKSVKLVVDTIEYCAQNVPKYSPVSVCGYHIRESGANPIQEMAYAFCIAKAYTDGALQRGILIDDFASRLSFNFDIYGNLFEQVAKFRGGRRLWAKIIREEYGAKNDDSCWLRMIAGGGGGGLTKEQPMNNIVRSAYYALISALSGTQTMALCSYDEAYTIPTEHSAEISLRTMQIMIHEMGICDTVDPLGGSYYVEAMTNTFEEEIKKEMKTVEKWDGIINAVATGKIQESVSKQAYEREMGTQSGNVPKVGVNIYTHEEESQEVEFHPYHEKTANDQIEKLKKRKAERNHSKVNECLALVKQDAIDQKNLMPSIISAVKEYCTVGEIVAAMKEVYGEFKEPIFFN